MDPRSGRPVGWKIRSSARSNRCSLSSCCSGRRLRLANRRVAVTALGVSRTQQATGLILPCVCFGSSSPLTAGVVGFFQCASPHESSFFFSNDKRLTVVPCFLSLVRRVRRCLPRVHPCGTGNSCTSRRPQHGVSWRQFLDRCVFRRYARVRLRSGSRSCPRYRRHHRLRRLPSTCSGMFIWCMYRPTTILA